VADGFGVDLVFIEPSIHSVGKLDVTVFDRTVSWHRVHGARRALDVLRSYSPDNSIPTERAAIEFLADLHHLTDLLGISFNHTVDYHHQRYRREIRDD
jgi:hypothetical protein